MNKRDNLRRRLTFHQKLAESNRTRGLALAAEGTALLAIAALHPTGDDLAALEPNERALLCITKFPELPEW